MKNFIKKITIILFLFFVNQSVMAKPVPPGSGEGDVPANILILLDNSKSMTFNKIGLGVDKIYGSTIDGSGDRILASTDVHRGGLFKFNSLGDPLNFEGIDDNGRSYEVTTWFPSTATDRTCDNLLTADGLTTSSTEIPNGHKRTAHVQYKSNVTMKDTGISGENLIFFLMWANQKESYIIGLNETTLQCRIAILQDASPTRNFDFALRDGEGGADSDLIMVALGTKSKSNRTTTFTSCNLTKSECEEVEGQSSTHFGSIADKSWQIKLDSDASHVYVTNNKGFYGYNLSTDKDAEGNYIETVPKLTSTSMGTPARSCKGKKSGNLSKVQDHTVFDVLNGDDDVFIAASVGRRHIQRLVFTNGTCKINRASTLGKKGGSANVATAGNLAFDKVYITATPTSLSIIGNTVLLTHGSYSDEFHADKIITDKRDTAWRNQIGGGKMTRWDGAKKAIKSVLSDSTLTSGANFGFGYWSGGVNNKDGGPCDKDGTRCKYWTKWDIAKNRHSDCVNNGKNACLAVPIGTEGASDAINILNTIQIRWGTDSHAWSQMAEGYFNAGAPNGDIKNFDPDVTCQLNYVIVISDGKMRNHGVPQIPTKKNRKGITKDKVEALREKGVKTLMVAYGDSIDDSGKLIFDYLAMHGSCNAKTLEEAEGRKDCDPTIEAVTPSQLKTKLASKIRQILAEKLAFTAPSITASVQEGGSLYQAQFEYEQYGEWKGTILRKEITGAGSGSVVIHEMTHDGNWDAAKKILTQAKTTGRNIWTALPVPEEELGETEEDKADRESLDYIGNWNNFTTSNQANLDAISDLFDRLGFELTDYHNSTSECSIDNGRSKTVGEDGTDDELKGLINFVRGQDYFDYNGNCNITEFRDHILGDIYHSQLIEIGPPDGNTDFTNNNEEAYYRSLKNYQFFRTKHANRKNIIYAGSNSGVLHAIDAKTGLEEWAFVPPFIAGKFPTIINEDLDGATEGIVEGEPAGGSNAIFGVDGSPVVHDVWIKGLSIDGTPETEENWHTILIIPYGRGGAGFSVLDVTYPIIGDEGPLHMFSVYNDYVNNKVYVMDYKGDIKEGGFDYRQTQFNISDSREAKRANLKYEQAAKADGDGTDSEVYTNRILIDKCTDDDDYTTGKFKDVGTSSCYESKVFNFDFSLGPDGTEFGLNAFEVFKVKNNEKTKLDYTSAKMVDGFLQIKFGETLTYNSGQSSDEGSVETESSNVFVSANCDFTAGIESKYDYSKLGETWSTPRIVRLPSPTSQTGADLTGNIDISNDKYVAIMGAGMSSNHLCAGSALYLIELGDMLEPGKIFGHEINKGPILIADLNPTRIKKDVDGSEVDVIRGSDISNAVPTNPIVITPDTAFNIPWRGALVYVNDREGKITKINLTNMYEDDNDVNDVKMFNQTTLFNLNANTDNKRYTFFSMDAGIGVTTKDFWLFGGTGNFNALAERTTLMDNVMYGVRDVDFPMFKHLNGVTIPLPKDSTDFMSKAIEGALNARSIDEAADCVDVSGESSGTAHCPDSEDAWKVRLDPGGQLQASGHSYRKVSAPPTLFKGQVYYPIYEPPPGDGERRCDIGNAYICVADDECGTNNTYKLIKGANPQVNDAACLFVREGVLSELVIFGDKLFANVAGPSEDEDTLYSILAAPGDVVGNNSGWRESGF